MDESGISSGFTQLEPSTLNYMSVPAKIELSSGGVRGGGYYPSSAEPGHGPDQTGYRPMKVSVSIALSGGPVGNR